VKQLGELFKTNEIMTPHKRISIIQKYLYLRGGNKESVNNIYLKIINEKFGFIKKEFSNFDKAKEVTKQFNPKTGKYEN
jgi:hypothetical protein